MDIGNLLKYRWLDRGARTGRRIEVRDRRIHLAAAMEWMCRAQDAYAPGGVAIEYSLRRGWGIGYPETTGYIIPTFIEYARVSGDRSYLDRAVRMADWELSIQKADGSFDGGPLGSGLGSFVFDTGQIVFGLIEAHRLTGDEKYLRGALRAGDWLVEVQDPAGMWQDCTYNGIAHAYYTRVAWGLAKLGTYVDADKYRVAATRNIEWAIAQRLPNGWFRSAGFTLQGHAAPFTHTIAYTIEGVLETGITLTRGDFVQAAAHSANALLGVRQDGYYAGTYRSDWSSTADYACLTGCAQIACIYLRLHEATGQIKYVQPAREANRFVCSCQELTGSPNTRGAISGSYPIWGGYLRYTFPNWPAKFFADALMLELRMDSNSIQQARAARVAV